MAVTHLYGLDVETDTSVDGLDPATSAIVAVAVATPWGDEVLTGAEAELLSATDAVLRDLPPGLLVTWNKELGPKWYAIAHVVLAVPETWIGGRIHGGFFHKAI